MQIELRCTCKTARPSHDKLCIVPKVTGPHSVKQKSPLRSLAAANEFRVLALRPAPKDARVFKACLHLVELFEVSGEDPFVVLALQGGHFHPQDAFVLGRQGLLHVLDHTPQQVRTQLCMQFAHLRHNQ